MLVNNFQQVLSVWISVIRFSAIGPVVDALTQAMAKGVEIILSAHLIPLTSILLNQQNLILNNAINHGI